MNIKTFEILELLSKISGRLDKEKILQLNKDNEELKFLFETSFNPYLNYGVKDFNLENNDDDSIDFDRLKEMRRKLIAGEKTGNTAKQYLEDFLSSRNELENKWLEAAFKKNITCGIDIKTINKIWLNLIPTFEVGLCKKLQSVATDESGYDVSLKEFEYKLEIEDWAIEPKYDGLRCITLIDKDGNIKFLSRNGKELFNLEHIEEELKQLKLTNIYLDGEIFAGTCDDSISIAHTETKHENSTKLKYYIFDILHLDEWKNKEGNRVYYIRKQRLYSLLRYMEFNYLEYVEYQETPKNLEGLKRVYQDILDQGYEGVVLKKIDSIYPFKRSKEWLKWKPKITEDLEITGFVEGLGRNKRRLGKFECNFNGVKVEVGGGFSDALREKFWIERESMIGKTIEVEAQSVTKDGSLRFPIFKRIREDK